MKPKTPYQRLLEDVQEYARKVRYASTTLMWFYQKDELSNNWRLDGLNERVRAADQLGYDVILRSTDRGLEVLYRKRAPDPSRYWDV